MAYNQLTSAEQHIILNKGTEIPGTGEYENLYLSGTFICRQCNNPLFTAAAKFHSGCGWPSFDAALPNGLVETLDADGRRTEITCQHCQGHLGHVFRGEQFTETDTRHCVNSASIRFVPEHEPLPPILEAD